VDTRIGMGLLASAMAAICGCSALPDRVESLEKARAEVRRFEQDSLASEVAATELAAAHKAIEQADDAYAKQARLEIVEHKAYVAQRYADISKQRIGERQAKEQLAEAELERTRFLLKVRERESELAAPQAKQTADERSAAVR